MTLDDLKNMREKLVRAHCLLADVWDMMDDPVESLADEAMRHTETVIMEIDMLIERTADGEK